MAKRRYKKSGLTLIEVMLAAAVLMVALIGAMAYRYYAALDARKADIQMTGARNAMMLLQSWRGAGGRPVGTGADEFDPTLLSSTGLTIEASGSGPSAPTGFTSCGFKDTNNDGQLDPVGSPKSFKVTTGGVVYYITLSSRDTVVGSTPKALNAHVGWRLDRQAGALGSSDKVFGFTTYISD